jgi:hypothetical protein
MVTLLVRQQGEVKDHHQMNDNSESLHILPFLRRRALQDNLVAASGDATVDCVLLDLGEKVQVLGLDPGKQRRSVVPREGAELDVVHLARALEHIPRGLLIPHVLQQVGDGEMVTVPASPWVAARGGDQGDRRKVSIYHD